FRLMELPEDRSVVFVEHALGDEARSQDKEVSQMRRLFGAMQADALAPVETEYYIHSIKKELEESCARGTSPHTVAATVATAWKRESTTVARMSVILRTERPATCPSTGGNGLRS